MNKIYIALYESSLGESIINGITIITVKIDDTVVNPIPIRTHFNKVNKNC